MLRRASRSVMPITSTSAPPAIEASSTAKNAFSRTSSAVVIAGLLRIDPFAEDGSQSLDLVGRELGLLDDM
jgi:hypothetical protein